MKYAIISDIHSNLESLNNLLLILNKIKIEKIVCLGDLVGYNPDPQETLDLIRSIVNIEFIRGNHDRAVAQNDFHNFSENAKIAAKWTLKNLNSGALEYLSKLKKGPRIIDNDFVICHGSIHDEDFYIFSKGNTKVDFNWMVDKKIKLMFYGHTHYQCAYSFGSEGVSIMKEKKFELVKDKYYIINPGSIGQPRDSDPRPGFAVYDSEIPNVSLYRYEYPIPKTQKKILEKGLPEFLAYRLALGK